jgi:hypothetical protein
MFLCLIHLFIELHLSRSVMQNILINKQSLLCEAFQSKNY